MRIIMIFKLNQQLNVKNSCDTFNVSARSGEEKRRLLDVSAFHRTRERAQRVVVEAMPLGYSLVGEKVLRQSLLLHPSVF